MTQKRFAWIALFLSLGLLIVAFCLAATYQLQWDESHTYVYYVQPLTSLRAAGSMVKHASGNNHWLNTILIKLTEVVSGINYSEIIIRLPNLLAMGGFLMLAYLICRKNLRTALPAFILLTTNYYLFDYFIQARGYGLAAFGILFSCWALQNWWAKQNIFSKKNNHWLILVMLGILIAIYANTISFLPAAGLLIVILIDLIKNKQVRSTVQELWPWLIIFTIGCLPMLAWHFLVTGQGIFKAEDGFWLGVIGGHGELWWAQPLGKWSLGILLTGLYILMLIKRGRKILAGRNFTLAWLIYLVLILIAGLVTSRGFPTQRVLLPGLPLLMLSLKEVYEWFLVDGRIQTQRWWQKLITPLLCLGLGGLLVTQIVLKTPVSLDDRKHEPDIRKEVYQQLMQQGTVDINSFRWWHPAQFYIEQSQAWLELN